MAIAFTKAVYAEPGGPITSAQHNSFARAVNDRILSGLGDAVWRIESYVLGLVRMVLVGDETGSTHAEGEWLEVFQHVRPSVSQWPDVGLGNTGLPEPNGPNLANPMMGWVYGNAGAGIQSEQERLSLFPVSYTAETDEVKWTTAKLQRGGQEPLGTVVSPARDLAMAFAQWAYWKNGYYNLSFGGFLPGPAQNTTPCLRPCDDPCDRYARDNLDIMFTATRPDVSEAGLHIDPGQTTTVPWALDPLQNCVQVHYYGTCEKCDSGLVCDDGRYDLHIANYWEMPDGWYVMLNTGAAPGEYYVDFLPRNDWIEGPYTQVRNLSRDYGDQIRRMVNAFNRDFRGSDLQRGDLQAYDLENAFDNQAFGTTQYALAPNFAVKTGPDSVSVKYPAWKLEGPGTFAAGTKLTSNYGGTVYSWHPGYVATHYFAMSRAAAPASLTVTHSGGNFVAAAGVVGAIGTVPVTGGLYGVEVALASELTLAAGESVEVEFTELVAYKPNWYDLYVVLRKGGAKLIGQAGTSLDGCGVEEDNASLIYEQYASKGCVVNVNEVTNIDSAFSENENALHESIRRMTRCVRLLNRFHLIDYAVIGGDSVLWFTPHPRTADYTMATPYDDGDPDVDVFEDMAIVNQSEGNFGQRWATEVWLKPFAEDATSDIELGPFADGIPDVNRCIFGDAVMFYDDTTSRFLNRQTDDYGYGCVFAQGPSGWNYTQCIGTVGGVVKYLNHRPTESDANRILFAKSCRVYEPPIEIRKIERVTEGLREFVKVTMKGRLHSTVDEVGGAPADVPRHGWLDDISSTAWDWATIVGEPFRSVENGLRLYLFYRWQDTLPPSVGALNWGDTALTTNFTGMRTSQYAATIPHFAFVQLLPEAFVDTNDLQDITDSVFLSDTYTQADMYLRAMCEGYVAGVGALKCDDPALVATPTDARSYDWRWRDLCQYEFGLPSLSAFASRETVSLGGLLTDADVRPDGPEGFGPLPNTYAAAEVFNRCVRVVNELHLVRVMLPWEIEQRDAAPHAVSLDLPVNIAPPGVDFGCGFVGDCPGGTVSWSGTPLPVGIGAWGAWAGTAATSISAFTSAGFSGGCGAAVSPYTSVWQMDSVRTVSEFRFSVVDWNVYQYAVPPKWRDMMGPGNEFAGAVFLVDKEVIWNTAEHDSATPGPCAVTTCLLVEQKVNTRSCVFMKNGSAMVDAGPQPPGGWFAHEPGLCSASSGITVTYSVLTDACPVLDVPVVAVPEWAQQPWITP